MPTDTKTDVTTLIVRFLQFCESAYKRRRGPHFPVMEAFSQSDLKSKSFETSTNVVTLLGSTPRHPHKQLLFSRQICTRRSESSPSSNNISQYEDVKDFSQNYQPLGVSNFNPQEGHTIR